MTAAEQRAAALKLANQRKAQRKRLLALVAAREIDWRAVILQPPECVRELLLSELLLLMPWMGRRRLERLGLLAHEHGITLTIRAGQASLFTRTWVARHALPRRAGGSSQPQTSRGRHVSRPPVLSTVQQRATVRRP